MGQWRHARLVLLVAMPLWLVGSLVGWTRHTSQLRRRSRRGLCMHMVNALSSACTNIRHCRRSFPWPRTGLRVCVRRTSNMFRMCRIASTKGKGLKRWRRASRRQKLHGQSTKWTQPWRPSQSIKEQEVSMVEPQRRKNKKQRSGRRVICVKMSWSYSTWNNTTITSSTQRLGSAFHYGVASGQISQGNAKVTTHGRRGWVRGASSCVRANYKKKGWTSMGARIAYAVCMAPMVMNIWMVATLPCLPAFVVEMSMSRCRTGYHTLAARAGKNWLPLSAVRWLGQCNERRMHKQGTAPTIARKTNQWHSTKSASSKRAIANYTLKSCKGGTH